MKFDRNVKFVQKTDCPITGEAKTKTGNYLDWRLTSNRKSYKPITGYEEIALFT